MNADNLKKILELMVSESKEFLKEIDSSLETAKKEDNSNKKII